MAVKQNITYLSSVLVLLAQVVLSVAVLATVTRAQVPVGDWTFDDGSGTKAVDSSGNGNTAILINGISWVAGEIGGAVSANGVNQYVSIPAIDLSGTNAVTVALWSNRTYSTGGGHVLFEATTNFNNSTTGFVFLPDDDTCLGISAALHGDVGSATNCYSQPSSGVWHHLAIVFDKSQTGGNQVALYVDGVLQTPNRNLSASTNTNNFGNNPIYIFSRAGTSNFDSGGVDDFRIYNSALTAAQIQQMYQIGKSQIGEDFVVSVDGTGTMTTQSLSTSTNQELLVAFVSYDGPSNGPQTATVSGGGLTWQLVKRSNSQYGTAEIWAATAPATPFNATVTSQPGTGSFHGSLTVIGFTNASGLGITGQAAAPTGAPDINLPGISAGNWVFGVGNDWDNAIARTPVIGQVLVHQRVDTQIGDTYWVQSTAAPSTNNGSVDIHDSAPTTDQWNYAAVEIVAKQNNSPDFTVSASSSSLSVAQGDQGTSAITTTLSGGFDSAIGLSTSGVPTGTTVSFNPQTIPAPGSGSSTMSIAVGLSTPAGTYSLTVIGNGGGVQQNAIVSLTVTGPALVSIAVTPANPSIAARTQQPFTATGTYSDGSHQDLTSSATWTSSTPSVATITSSGLATGAAAGNTTIQATSGAINGSTGLTVTAPGSFTVSTSPAPLSVAQGNQGTTTITTAVSGGFDSSISLSASGAPTGTTLSFNPGTIAAPGAGNSTMTITVGSSTPVGTYPITVTGNGGGTQQNTTVSLTVTAPVLVLVSVAVTPVSPSIATGIQQQFTATGTYSDGSHQDLTSSATWTSSAPSVATISSSGLATALSAGSTTIQAASGSINGSTGLTVTTQITNTIWAPSTTPTVVDSGDGNSVEIGVKFRADSDGHITGLRFYKASANVGTHVGNIWTSSGTLLGTATFTNETASGWQQVSFNNPIPVTANTTYIASYFAPVGHYSEDDGYFAASGVDNPPLHALANGVDGANGVYIYNPSSAFPSNGYVSSNYWVDVVYTTASSYSLSGKISGTGGAGATVTLSGTRNATATADGSGNYSFAGLGNGSYTLTPSNSGVTFTPPSQTVTVNGTSLSGVNFTATLTNPLTISGTISGAGGAGAMVTLSGAGNATTAADGSGNYAFYQLVNGTYSVSPSLTGYIFTPGTQTVTLNGSSATSVNFTSQTATHPSVVLSWTASTSPVVGYNAYRSTISGGPYTKLNSSLIATTSYTDQTVQSGSTYYYVGTAVDSQGNESSYSNQAVATVP